MPAKLNFFKTPAPVRLVSSRTVSTSTGISGCYQPHRQTAMPGQKSIYETFLVLTRVRQGRGEGGAGGGWRCTFVLFIVHICLSEFRASVTGSIEFFINSCESIGGHHNKNAMTKSPVYIVIVIFLWFIVLKTIVKICPWTTCTDHRPNN
jgi:hypothetical protein